MFKVMARYDRVAGKYPQVYDGVVGRRFDTLADAQDFLTRSGWEEDALGSGDWTKDGPTRMCGQIGVSMVHYACIVAE